LLEIGLEVRDVEVLLADKRQFALVFERTEGSIAQQRDDRDEELRSHDEHLGETVRHVDNPLIVELAFGLEQRHQDRVLAALLRAVLVELGEVVLVLLLHRVRIALVLHLEHDRDDLVAVFRYIRSKMKDGILAGSVQSLYRKIRYESRESMNLSRFLICVSVFDEFNIFSCKEYKDEISIHQTDFTGKANINGSKILKKLMDIIKG